MEPLVTCTKCSTNVPVKDLRADKTGRGWVCIACYNRQHNKISHQDILQKPQTVKKQEPPEVPQNKEPRKISSYKCVGCKYKFESSVNALDKQCPYCSRLGTIEKVQSASEILNSIRDMPDY